MFLASAAAVALFAAAFALHVIAGAAELEWLFAMAVVLIYLFASSLPTISWLLGGCQPRPYSWWALHVALALVFSGGALWAAAGRTLAWWVPLGAAALVVVGTASTYTVLSGWRRWRLA